MHRVGVVRCIFMWFSPTSTSLSPPAACIWHGSALVDIYFVCTQWVCFFPFRFLLSPFLFICLVYLSFGEHARVRIICISYRNMYDQHVTVPQKKHSNARTASDQMWGGRGREKSGQRRRTYFLLFSLRRSLRQQIHMGSKVQQIACIPLLLLYFFHLSFWIHIFQFGTARPTE